VTRGAFLFFSLRKGGVHLLDLQEERGVREKAEGDPAIRIIPLFFRKRRKRGRDFIEKRKWNERGGWSSLGSLSMRPTGKEDEALHLLFQKEKEDTGISGKATRTSPPPGKGNADNFPFCSAGGGRG